MTADQAKELRRTFTQEQIAKWKFCPICGRPNIDQPRVEGVERCTPGNCETWVHEATFNHQTREWDKVEGAALVIEPDEDGDAPDWFYEALSDRLVKIGGRSKGDPQWEDKSYRMAYASVVWKALRDAMPDRGTE